MPSLTDTAIRHALKRVEVSQKQENLADGDGRGGAGPAPAEGRDIHQFVASMPESGLPGGGGVLEI